MAVDKSMKAEDSMEVVVVAAVSDVVVDSCLYVP